MKKITPLFYFVLIFVLMISFSCAPQVNNATPDLEIIDSPSPAIIPTIFPSPSATITPAALPPTLTPLPALNPNQALAKIRELLQTNGNCNLPCWWGIVPGKTTFAEAQNFFRQFNPLPFLQNDAPNKQFANYLIPVSENISPAFGIDVYLDIEDKVVKIIAVESIESATNFGIQKMLFDYGQPSEIWVFAYRSYLGGVPPADVLLFYPSRGILARYSTELTEINENKDSATICLDGSPSLVLWSPIEQIDFERAQTYARLDYREYGRLLLPLYKATNISLDEFYEYRMKERICIKTTLSLWPDP
jgi:hypothetical protein